MNVDFCYRDEVHKYLQNCTAISIECHEIFSRAMFRTRVVISRKMKSRYILEALGAVHLHT